MAGAERETQYKATIFEQLFDARGGAAGLSAHPNKALVTLDDVRAQMAEYNARAGVRGKKNVPAFFKDFVRNIDNANEYWPTNMRIARYTARQVTGGGACFAFEPTPDGQKTPFRKFEPSEAAVSAATDLSLAEIPPSIIQFADSSDRWFSALCATLEVVQAHFAGASDLRRSRLDIDEAFLGIRGRYAAIDRLYVGRRHPKGERLTLIPAEIKFKDDVYDGQVANLARELQESSIIKSLRKRGCQFVDIIPLAVKWLQKRPTGIGHYQALSGNQIYVVQFEAIDMNETPPIHPRVTAETVFNIAE